MSLYRARSCAVRLARLSLISKQQYNPLFVQRSSFRRWFSASTGEGEGETETETSLVNKRPTNQVLIGRSRSNLIRSLNRRIIKKRSNLQPKQPALVKPPVRYATRWASRRSLHKHRRSANAQHLYDYINEANFRPKSHWRWTLDFLLRHTLDIGEILNFRVIIGKGAAAEARRALSEPDTHISQICQRNESQFRIEETSDPDGTFILNLTGSEDSVRKSLLEIVGAVGKITAVRVPDPKWEALLLDAWKGVPGKRPEIRLLGDGDASVDDKMMTVHTSHSTPPKYTKYQLTKRADEITRPTEWTKDSLEEYVAALVGGRVPTYLARSLYPNPPDHQATVISLLADLFTSEHTKSAVSLSALKMAIGYIESRGAGFRGVSRSIFSQVELLDLPMDADIFNIFLVSASKAGNLDGFNSMLRSMVRKGHAPQGRTWVSFLQLVQSPTAKRYVVAKLRSRELDRNSSTRRAIGRQMAVVDLESLLSRSKPIDIQQFIDDQSQKYGVGWLNTITLNRLMDILCGHSKMEDCNALLDLVYTTQLVRPDVITLNTILSHMIGISQVIRTLQLTLARWPKLALDDVSYFLLFRIAWRRRFPNMLRVIWRYAALARLANHDMRRLVMGLLAQDREPTQRQAFLRPWEDVIFGKDELAEMRRVHPHRVEAWHLISHYIQQARNKQLSVDFVTKLEEAFVMDMKINQLLKEGTVMTPSMRELHTVEIPLESKPELELRKIPFEYDSIPYNEG
ncbi:hypothetical protein F5Y04DRAFT_242977 [Hypomontagnella monticulosa]|nr:hypothetical protein F5Y04DRAFT_242977 [Hypomontagnella monticulosa]